MKECSSLADAGFSVHLLVADGKGDEIKNGVRIVDAGAKSGSRLHRMTRTAHRLYRKAAATNADIYHLHDPELLALAPLLLKRGRVVYDSHEDLPRTIGGKYWIPALFRSALSFFVEKVENHLVRRLSGVIAATPHIAERFERISSPVRNIGNYPILEEFEDIDRKSAGENIVCYVGGLAAIRGIYEMVRAMEHVDGKLLLAGYFSDQREQEIARSLPGWNKVVELGFRDRDGIRETLASSKVGLAILHPIVNYVDALPIKLFEYMAAGLPVIASRFPILVDIIETTGCGICVDPLDPAEIAEAIRWIFNPPGEASAMGEAGRRAARNMYNWNSEKKKLLAFYKQLLSESGE